MEIKFRAWDGKQYHYQNDQYLSSFIWRFVRDVNYDNGLNSEHEAYLKSHLNDYLEQYTGLKDKNGREIYDGDIIQDGLRYRVYFSEDRAGWFPFATDDGCGCCSHDLCNNLDSYVIGNIHENPELLEDCNA